MSASYPSGQLKPAQRFAGGLGVGHALAEARELHVPENRPDGTRRRPHPVMVGPILIDGSDRHGEERRRILGVVAQRFLRGFGVQAIPFRRDDHAEQPNITRCRQSGDLIM